MDCGAEGVKEMTRLECAVKLLWNLRFQDTCNSEDVEAFAYAIMELGRSELKEEIIKRNEEPPRYEVNSPIKMESVGAPPREWM